MQTFFSLLLASGMRPGEALGLKWPDVDFKNKRVTVNRALVRYRKGGWELKDTKTGKGRTIPIPTSTMKDLWQHKIDKDEIMLMAKPGKYDNQGFVFAADNGQPLDSTNVASRHLKPLLKKAGLPDIRLYNLPYLRDPALVGRGKPQNCS